jgi:TolA-binding protein
MDEENGEPLAKTVEEQLGAILSAITRLDGRMSAMEQRLATQATALSNLSDAFDQLNGKLKEMETKTSEMEQQARDEKDMLEGKLASLRESLARNTNKKDSALIIDQEPEEPNRSLPSWGPGLRATPPGQQVSPAQQSHDAWAGYLRNKAAGSAKVPVQSPSQQAPRAQPQPYTRDNKYTKFSSEIVWVKGYPRDLTTKQLHAEASRILGLNDIDPEDVEVIVRGFGRSFAYRFHSADAARDFREEVRDALPSWTDPRDKDIHQLKIHSDKPLFVRLRDRVFSELWKKVLPKILAKDPSAKLGQSRGRLWVIVADCPYCLFSSRPDPDDAGRFLLDADIANCQDYNISQDEATAWMELALRAVA